MVVLQQLPWTVLAQVVRRVVDGGQLRYRANVVGEDKPTEALVPLLYTCRALREPALGHMCQALAITVNCAPESLRVEFSAWPDSVLKPDGEQARLARRVRMAVDFWSIINGRAGRLLGAQRLMFPGAHTLVLCFEHSELGFDEASADAGPAVRAFVAAVRAMMPRLRDVRVEHSVGYAMGRTHFREALTRQLGAALAMPIAPTTAATLVVPLLPQLTSIAFSWNIYHRDTVKLVHNSAATLRALTVTFNHLADIGLLVASAGGAAIEYPELEELRLSCWYYLEEPQVLPVTAHTPFPRLRLLNLDMDYPFGDDTLFRGNAATLAVISLNTDAALIAMARRYRVFDNGRCASLRHVRVKNINTSRLKPGTPARQVAEFALGLAPAAQTLTIEDITMERALLVSLLSTCAAPQQQQHLDTLQVLVIPDASLTLAHIAAILARLPCLTEIHCHYSGLNMPPHEQDAAVLRFVDEHRGVGRLFAVLRMGHCGDTSVGDIARGAIALALLCPRFTYAAVPAHLARNFNNAITHLMATPPFAPFKSRFAPLLVRTPGLLHL